MSTLVHKKFTLPSGCACRTIIMRETSGIDERNAALMAETRGGTSAMGMELIRCSIVAVDDKRVQHPFIEMDKWNTKTRSFVRAFWESLNDIKEEEVGLAVATGEPIAPMETVGAANESNPS